MMLTAQAKSSKAKDAQSWLLLLALLAAVALTYWLSRPFTDTLSEKVVSMRSLTVPQRMNIQMAAQQLDGTVIRPKEKFSFNALVGPRTAERGYLAAPSYVGADTSSTMGGGICLLSSALYQTALEAGLNVTRRTAHTRTVSTVPPGLDATVWYGKSDLCFENNSSNPIELKVKAEPYSVKVTIMGQSGDHNRGRHPDYVLTRLERYSPDHHLLVDVYRKHGLISTVVSHDIYALNR